MGNSIKNQLAKINVAKIKSPTGRTYGEELKIAANHLANCIQYRVDEFYNSYDPILYERTYGFYNSLSVEDIADIKVVGNTISIRLFFDEGAYHESLINGYRDVNTAYLMNYGYKVKKDVWFKNIKNFGVRDGANFVEKGIDDFNKTNVLGIKINIQKPNTYYV